MVFHAHLIRSVCKIDGQVKKPGQFIQQARDQFNNPLIASGHGDRAMELDIGSNVLEVAVFILKDIRHIRKPGYLIQETRKSALPARWYCTLTLRINQDGIKQASEGNWGRMRLGEVPLKAI
jgi:hypothetical protein